jgi:lysophospholipase L1-like esterase
MSADSSTPASALPSVPPSTRPVMLFGDSMLARFTKPRIRHLERELRGAATVYNCAAGGWDSGDGAARASHLGRLDWAVVVLSFGANDCAPWKRVAIDRFTTNIETIVRAFDGAHLVAFLPPVIQEIDQPGRGCRRNHELDGYRDVLRAAVGAGACLETARILGAGAAGRGLEADGLHLTDDSYARLMPALGQVIWHGLGDPGPDEKAGE